MSSFSWFSALQETLWSAKEFVDSGGLFRLRAFANALYETLLDDMPRGAAARQYKGHNHAPDTSAGEFGGRPVARGTLQAAGALGQSWLSPTISVASTWIRADNNLGSARPGQMFYAPVSRGIVSTLPIAAPPYLEALIHLDYTAPAGSPSLDVRITNLSYGGASAVCAVTAGAGSASGLFTITKIPAFQGWNRLNLEVRSNLSGVGGSLTVDLLDLIILERPSVSVPASAGSASLGG